MPRIYIPSSGPDDWRALLADPDKQWRAGYSAYELAHCWEAAGGFPTEVLALFSDSGVPTLQHLHLLAAFPEYRVALPGRGRASQNDLFVLARTSDGQLVAIMIEGKVAEAFGPTLAAWQPDSTPEKCKRLHDLQALLGVDNLPPTIRYQLLHRTASAVIAAQQFCATTAIMLVHSFSADQAWFDDYRAFLALFGVEAIPGRLHCLRPLGSLTLYAAWVQGSH